MWGYTKNEHYKNTEEILKLLCECVSKGGNLILNVGPKPDGTLPEEFTQRSLAIGKWLDTYGEAIYGIEDGDLTEFATCGYEMLKGNTMYLVFNIWSGQETLRFADMVSKAEKVTLLGRNEELFF